LWNDVHVVTTEKAPLGEVTAEVQPSVSLDDCGNTTSISTSSSLDTGVYSDWLAGIKTEVLFSIKSVEGGPFETPLILTPTVLKLPKQIDLEAGATP
jgi:hypothetical protein